MVLLAQAALLGAIGVAGLEQINPDGIAYVRIAGYWAAADGERMISAYWGPLLSWIMVPSLAAGLGPMASARIAMLASGLVFTLGGAVLIRRLGLGAVSQLLAAGTLALASLGWSLLVNPDLLLTGLLAIGIGGLLAPHGAGRADGAFRAGLWFGLGYLAKPIALPFGIVLGCLLAAVRFGLGQTSARDAGRAAAATALGCLAVAGPWIVTISLASGFPTVGTSGSINHALVGPPDVERFHPFARQYHEPDPGRLSQWEDPSEMAYARWSPFESREAMAHQLRVSLDNAGVAWRAATTIDRFGVGLAALGVAALAWPRRRRDEPDSWRSRLLREPWRLAVVPLLLMMAAYLPLYANSLRYYFLLAPLSLAAGLGLAEGLALRGPIARALAWALRLALVASLVPWPPVPGVVFRGQPLPSAEFQLADHLKAVTAQGVAVTAQGEALAPPEGASPAKLAEVLGGGPRRQAPAGLQVAFFAGLTYLGAEVRPSLDRLRASGADLVLVPLRSPLRRELARASDYRDLGAPPTAAGAPPLIFTVFARER